MIFKGKIVGAELQSSDISIFSSVTMAGFINDRFHSIKLIGNKGSIKTLIDLYGVERDEITVQIGNGETL